MGLQFHETVYGKRFFEYQLPNLTEAINRLAGAVEENNKLLKKESEEKKCEMKEFR